PSRPAGLEIRVAADDDAAEALSDWPTVLVDGNPSEVLLSGANLTTVIVPYAGINGSLRRAALARPHLSVTNSPCNAGMGAQHATALLLAVANRVVTADAALRRGDWGDKGSKTNLGKNLAGARALLLGHGSIGRALAPILASLGLRVTAFTRSGTTADATPAVGPSAWREVLSDIDVVVCTLPATPETLGLVGAGELGALPHDAIVV